MTQASTAQAVAICKQIVDDRDLEADRAEILLTLEHVVATILLAVMQNDPVRAAGMLHLGLSPRVLDRLANYDRNRAAAH